MNATERFARHVLETPSAVIPVSARAAARTFILDTIGVGIAGARAAHADDVLRAARRWGVAGVGGAGHVLGRRERLPAPSAAFVNGFQIHCQEYDCVHEGAVVHPMATIFAALGAEAERLGHVSGKRFADAVVLSVDVAAGLGLAAHAPIRFFRPANAGLFGATLGIARLRGFDVGRALDALGYALAHCSGTMQAHVEGKPALPIQIGNAARAALIACDIAEAGLPGPRNVFEGPFGYLPLFEGDFELAPVLASLGTVFRVEEVSHKPFPTGRAAQGGIVGVQKLKAEGVSAENLESLVLTAPPLIKRLVGRAATKDMAVNYARLCFPYLGAVVLRKGRIGLDDFTAEALSSADTFDLAQRIEVVDDGGENPAAFTPQRLEARLTNGAAVATQIDRLYGSPRDAMTEEAQRDKFGACVTFGAPQMGSDFASALIGRIEALEEEQDVARLLRFAAGVVDGRN
jgi:2-methylcitrate dehydratase PrpD